MMQKLEKKCLSVEKIIFFFIKRKNVLLTLYIYRERESENVCVLHRDKKKFKMDIFHLIKSLLEASGK